jgi:hypothetical protein
MITTFTTEVSGEPGPGHAYRNLRKPLYRPIGTPDTGTTTELASLSCHV